MDSNFEEFVEDVESSVDEDEEAAEDDVEALTEDVDVLGIDVREEVVEDEGVTASQILSTVKWYSKLSQLREILQEELENARGLERELLSHELREVEKEMEFVRRKIYEGLKAYRLTCSKECRKCPLELVCEKFSTIHTTKKRGSSEPWIIPILLKRYSLE